MKQAKQMRSEVMDFEYFDIAICCEWNDNKAFPLLASKIHWMADPLSYGGWKVLL